MHILVGSQNFLYFKVENLGVIASDPTKCKAPSSGAWFFQVFTSISYRPFLRTYEYLQKKKNFANQESFISIRVQNIGL